MFIEYRYTNLIFKAIFYETLPRRTTSDKLSLKLQINNNMMDGKENCFHAF